MVSYEKLIDSLEYNPESGEFIRLKSYHSRFIGKPAGSLSGTGHVQIKIAGTNYYGHQLAWLYMTGIWPTQDIDHKNRIRNDNSWENLRHVSHKINCRNQPIHSNNTSGVAGVYWYKRDQQWVARIQVGGKRKFLGKFTDKKDATKARKIAEIKYGYKI